MKKLIKSDMKRLAYILLAISFLISNGFSYRIKKKAQSDLAKNTLSFLLYQEDSYDLVENIKKFNKESKALFITYAKNNGETIYKDSRFDLKSLNSGKDRDGMLMNSSYKSILKVIKTYTIKDDRKILSLSGSLSIINRTMFLIFILLIILTKIILDNKSFNKLSLYIKDLSYDNYDNFIIDPDFDEFRPVIYTYMQIIKDLRGDSNIYGAKLSEIINVTSNLKEGFILFDGKGEIELINDSAIRYLDSKKNDNISNIINDRRYTLALREARILKRSKSLNIKLNGYDLRVLIDPLSRDTKKSYAMIILDNSEEKRAEQMRREFSANVTHELKSPLTSINGYAELIGTGIAKDDDVKKFANIIYKEGNRLLEIIDDIIKISRLDEQNFEKDFVEVDISQVVNSTIEKYQKITDSKDIDVISHIKPFRIKTSSSLFYDLVSNIYENAIKYNNIGGSIRLNYILADNNYKLIIEDTGIGISKVDIERIFERFYVVDKSRKRNQKSTGLGLSIVKHISSYLGYKINVESKLDEGSKFIIEIPLEQDRY